MEKIFITVVRSLAVVLVAALAGCGSTQFTKMQLPGFAYVQYKEIHDRVYISDLTGFVIEVTYNEEMKLPHVRAGFVTGSHIVDTTGNEMGHVVRVRRRFEIPWLFTSDIETVSTPMLIDEIPWGTNENEKIEFDPDAEAVP